ncbi:hypothetical protein BDA99DRAFT_510079 [Phascolomyces articulosus]|uniref:F-box domain-containing protein n=1 Tax=Phascolomyces articulosus TaxID=60185 RepID=A0AAD5K0I0_9FUNG|nr:hypothetical protein BDA99DRAFT_510079 [Phascolomyces articulosus]
MQKRSTPTSKPTSDPQAKRQTQNHPWMEPFELGRKAFAEAKYKDAIHHFSDAITMNSNNNITLIDCRAAAYEKDGNLVNGLEDALTMIKASPTQSKGYLRAGKLFSLQNRYDKALAIYNRAMEKVTKNDPRYSQLSEMRKTVIQQHKKQKQTPIDFIQVLPFDIVAHIFELLSFERRVQCMAVSKAWRALLKDWSGMWREIDFSSPKMSAYAMKQYMSYVKGRYVRKFTLTGKNRNQTNKMIQSLIDRDCHYIERLGFIECEVQLDLFLRTLRLMGRHVYYLQLTDTGIPFSALPDILKTTPTIRRLVYQDETPTELTLDQSLPLTHLELSFTSAKRMDYATLQNMIKNCPDLTHLSLYPTYGDPVITLALQSCPNLTSLRYQQYHIGWDDDPSNDIKKTTPKQRGISELVFPTFCEISDDTLISIIETHHNSLKILDLRGCVRLSTRTTDQLSNVDAPRLREIFLENSAEFSESSLCGIMQHHKGSLEVVHLQSVVSVTNAVVGSLTGATALKKLNISNCSKVTGTGLRQLLDSVEGLQHLVLNNCNNINNDAVNYARDKLGRRGVECRYATY